ncbi:integral membrane sensor hybrid histidine kinase [Arcobacter nitrofigilis DSM 7299]|uniref:histidine kinase n=1 Tax=Arcobacter nitrofigilis (strain ATCC 33309 / DSM 7299 / CCUG 15893 / LMG 7604 / NCTC 12251 / CI) TaxID=572480 RepID=D5V3D4_ARCNC|nr:response regulator [Arcobacter nitrofigilis]ADG92716.1 integral membrane sensor hybrid histidine kinase [Arcobacter nitrofigilis DSM 7299]
MNLKKLFMLLFILNTISFISVAIVINKYQNSTVKLENAYQMQYKSLILAHELRQSSDDLTRMARTYVITGNPRFEEQYKTVLDIRNGKKNRPKRYNGIFWDFYTLDGTKAVLEGEKVPLRELMKRANFPDEELNLLFASQNESDDLTKLEHKAMNAVKGIFQDENGNFTIKGKPDFKLARELMHSDEYHKAKIRIMQPLDNFYKAFEKRTQEKVNDERKTVKEQEFYVNVIVLFSVIFFLMSFFIILFRIIYPIDLLRVAMLKLSSNDMSVELDKNKYDDEVGDMIGSVRIFKDNTKKLIESEHQIKLAMEEANSANKAKSIFLARMSHELRTPLNAILGFSNILKKSMNATQEEKNNLNIIKRSGEHLLNIINEILELSKIEAGKIEIIPKVFNLKELIEDINSIFAFRCKEKGLEFKIILDDNLPEVVKMDELRLRQILINLLSNSLKFTNEGEISLYLYEKSQKLFFEIKDTGIGIESKDLKRVFKPFEQIKHDDYNKNGTGLGLSITKELVTLMNGSIYAKSKVNVGTQFYFSVDYKNTNSDDIAVELKSKDIIGIEKNIDKKTILVVDDIEVNRNLLTQILNSHGFEVLQASSGYEAIELFKKEDLSLIFMDIKMSGLDGLETIKIIRKEEKGKDISIVAVSANVFNEDKEIAIVSGANDFLAKPVDEKELLIVLSKYFNLKLKYLENSDEKVDTLSRISKLDKEFFVKLNEFALLMDSSSIEQFLESSDIEDDLKLYFKELVENFKYKEINEICIKNIQ